MAAMKRLITYADVPDQELDPKRVSVQLRHELELADGRQVLLLNDRGWGSGWTWTQTSRKYFEETALMCVGPDEPYANRSREDMEIMHWTQLQQIANQGGVRVDAAELARLPHDVVLSERLLARIGS
jgi:hypothetical protein